jgi:hypothetical protein
MGIAIAGDVNNATPAKPITDSVTAKMFRFFLMTTPLTWKSNPNATAW